MDSNNITLDISKLTMNFTGTIELDRPLLSFDGSLITRSSNRRFNTHIVESMTGATNPFEFLPSEIMCEIFSKLKVRDKESLRNVALVSKECYSIVYSHLQKKSSLEPQVQDQLSSMLEDLCRQQVALQSNKYELPINLLKFENIPYLGDAQIERLIEYIYEPQLIESLSFKNCPNLTDKSLELVLNFPNLQSLDLSHNSNFTFKGFKWIQGLKNLKQLHINWRTDVTIDAFKFLFDMQNMPILICYTSLGSTELKREFFLELQEIIRQSNKPIVFNSTKLDTSLSSPIVCAQSILTVWDR